MMHRPCKNSHIMGYTGDALSVYRVRYHGNHFFGSKRVAVVMYSRNNKAPQTVPYISIICPRQMLWGALLYTRSCYEAIVSEPST